MSATQGGLEYQEQLESIQPRRTRIDLPHEPPQRDHSSENITAREEPTGTTADDAQFADLSNQLLEVEEPTAAMVAAVTGENPEIRREQLQLQVAQLAGHLRQRLREVDRREATLNARVAQLESDLRASRLWLSERELAFQEREKELLRQIEVLNERSEVRPDDPSCGAIDLETRTAELNEIEQQLRLREDELRERRFEVDRQGAALRHAQQLWQHERERQEVQLKEARSQFERESTEWRQQFERETAQMRDEQEQQLQTAEELLKQQVEILEQDRENIGAERRTWDEQKSRQRQAIDELRKAAEDEVADRRMRLEARQQWIERQKAGLEQVRDEALRLHRQSLEMRLLAEQVWSQVTGTVSPAEVTQALAELRLKLAEQYKIEEQLLAKRREELLALSEKLAAQHAEISQLRDGVRDWGNARQADIERQAATLVERELALDAQQEEMREREQRWNSDRRRYEQQVRDLSARLRHLPIAA